MNVFNQNFRVRHGNIIVAEIPETLYSEVYQHIGDFLHITAGNADNGANRVIVDAEILQIIYMPYGNSFYHVAADSLILVENSDKFEAAVFIENFVCYSLAQISGADKYSFQFLVNAENFADFLLELRNVVAIALLAESAKTVEVVADLGSGKPHSVSKFFRTYTNYSVIFKALQKSVISGKSFNYRYGNVFSLFHTFYLSEAVKILFGHLSYCLHNVVAEFTACAAVFTSGDNKLFLFKHTFIKSRFKCVSLLLITDV